MKKLLIIAFLAISGMIQAQEQPTEPANGFSFSIGTKFTIKLVPVDSVNFDYSVISFEPFQEIVDTYKNDNLFEKKGEDNTIVFYFCLGTYGETKKEKHESPAFNEKLFQTCTEIYIRNSKRGLSSIIINGFELPAGMYMYTLLVNNTIIDTKKMILTK